MNSIFFYFRTIYFKVFLKILLTVEAKYFLSKIPRAIPKPSGLRLAGEDTGTGQVYRERTDDEK
jgi:hypothetical protein